MKDKIVNVFKIVKVSDNICVYSSTAIKRGSLMAVFR